jgi:signal peptidase II
VGPSVRAWRLAALVTGAVVLLDQATKQIVIATLERGEHRNVFLGLDITYVRNKGVAFGALGGGGALVTALTIAAVTLLALYFALHTEKPWLWLPFGMVAGGALGNLADRARDGAVIDFLDPVLWPAFNLADVSIVVGILGLLYVIAGPPAKSGNDRGSEGGWAL